MTAKVLVCLALCSASCAMAASPGFLLGLDYSEWALGGTPIGVDNSGALYVAFSCNTETSNPPTCVLKLSGDGKAKLWEVAPESATMAVDPSGGLYSVYGVGSGIGYTPYLERLNADGSVAWQTQIGNASSGIRFALAVDSKGRAFVEGAALNQSPIFSPVLARVDEAGAVVYFPSPGSPNIYGVAVDPTGSDVVELGMNGTDYCLWRLASDGVTWNSAVIPYLGVTPAPQQLAVAPNGDAVVYGLDATSGNQFLWRYDATGAAVFSTATGTGIAVGGALGLALDPAGNAYITGYSGGLMHAVRNSLAACGTAWMSVYARDGSILQTTYLPGAGTEGSSEYFYAPIVIGANSTVFVLENADASYTPTQTGPFGSDSTAPLLLRFSPNSSAQTYPLACAGNAASYSTGAISPGELVTLFGTGLGPERGVAPQATLQSPYPTQAGNVEVTFDGTPAPLMWVQDAQINAAAPWSLTAGQNTQLCVSYNSVPTNCLTLAVAQTAPGVFTVDGTYALAVNQDGSINSADHPAPAGSIVSIWATGLGPITPAQADGTLIDLPLPNDVLAAQVGTNMLVGIPMQPMTLFISYAVTYAGPAPYLVAGESQINFQLPAGFQTPVQLSAVVVVGSATSQSFRIHVVGE
ncbi:MAG: hypothetical protein ACLQKA_14500 [Bryobacteraceae bacterium]